MSGLGPTGIGVEDLFFVNSNDEVSVDYDLKEANMYHSKVPEKLVLEEGNILFRHIISLPA